MEWLFLIALRPSGDRTPFGSWTAVPATFALPGEAVVWRWVENPYWQLFCGETWLHHQPPIDSSSLTRWRQRIGSEGMEWLLAQTIQATTSAEVIKHTV